MYDFLHGGGDVRKIMITFRVNYVIISFTCCIIYLLTNVLNYFYNAVVLDNPLYIFTCRAIAFITHALINFTRRVNNLLSSVNCFRCHLPVSIQY